MSANDIFEKSTFPHYGLEDVMTDQKKYESPINVMLGQLETQIENEIMIVTRRVGVNVDRDELIKALNYDRDQYRKGYNDAKVHAHWIIDGDWAECSNPKCREASKISIMEHKDYCPACGARMCEEIEIDG